MSNPETKPPGAQYFLAAGGRPFTDPDAAAIKRDLLAFELGRAADVAVVPHPEGGYAIRCLKGAAKPVAASKGPYPEKFRLSPSLRGYIGQHVLAAGGLFLVVQPQRVIHSIGFDLPEDPALATLFLGAVMFSGAVLALICFIRVLWAYMANTYAVDRDGVEQIHWYWERGRLRRRAPRVNFAHLRAVDVDQTLLQMILSVGAVKLAAGGTDTYEVELQRVSAPRRLQTEFQRRLRASLAPHSPLADRSTDL